MYSTSETDSRRYHLLNTSKKSFEQEQVANIIHSMADVKQRKNWNFVPVQICKKTKKLSTLQCVVLY